MGHVKGFAGIKFGGWPLNPRKPQNLVPAKFSTFKVQTNTALGWRILSNDIQPHQCTIQIQILHTAVQYVVYKCNSDLLSYGYKTVKTDILRIWIDLTHNSIIH